MIEIKIEDDVVNLYKDYKDSPIYYIRVEDLLYSRNDEGEIISHWVDHLIFKTWMEEEALYKLAEIIQKKYPNNNINWFASFFPYEKRQYVEHVSATRKIISGNKENMDKENDSSERLKISVEENNEFVSKTIKEIIKNKLIKYGIQY